MISNEYQIIANGQVIVDTSTTPEIKNILYVGNAENEIQLVFRLKIQRPRVIRTGLYSDVSKIRIDLGVMNGQFINRFDDFVDTGLVDGVYNIYEAKATIIVNDNYGLLRDIVNGYVEITVDFAAGERSTLIIPVDTLRIKQENGISSHVTDPASMLPAMITLDEYGRGCINAVIGYWSRIKEGSVGFNILDDISSAFENFDNIRLVTGSPNTIVVDYCFLPNPSPYTRSVNVEVYGTSTVTGNRISMVVTFTQDASSANTYLLTGRTSVDENEQDITVEIPVTNASMVDIFDIINRDSTICEATSDISDLKIVDGSYWLNVHVSENQTTRPRIGIIEISSYLGTGGATKRNTIRVEQAANAAETGLVKSCDEKLINVKGEDKVYINIVSEDILGGNKIDIYNGTVYTDAGRKINIKEICSAELHGPFISTAVEYDWTEFSQARRFKVYGNGSILYKDYTIWNNDFDNSIPEFCLNRPIWNIAHPNSFIYLSTGVVLNENNEPMTGGMNITSDYSLKNVDHPHHKCLSLHLRENEDLKFIWQIDGVKCVTRNKPNIICRDDYRYELIYVNSCGGIDYILLQNASQRTDNYTDTTFTTGYKNSTTPWIKDGKRTWKLISPMFCGEEFKYYVEDIVTERGHIETETLTVDDQVSRFNDIINSGKLKLYDLQTGDLWDVVVKDTSWEYKNMLTENNFFNAVLNIEQADSDTRIYV